jgi:hypothetical protein
MSDFPIGRDIERTHIEPLAPIPYRGPFIPAPDSWRSSIYPRGTIVGIGRSMDELVQVIYEIRRGSNRVKTDSVAAKLRASRLRHKPLP